MREQQKKELLKAALFRLFGNPEKFEVAVPVFGLSMKTVTLWTLPKRKKR